MAADSILILVGISFLMLVYLGVAAVCCLETLIENRRGKKTADTWLAGGMLLSLFWPILVIVAFGEILFRRSQPSPDTDPADRSTAGSSQSRAEHDPDGRIGYDAA